MRLSSGSVDPVFTWPPPTSQDGALNYIHHSILTELPEMRSAIFLVVFRTTSIAHFEPKMRYFIARNRRFEKFLSYGSPSCPHDEIFLLMVVIENGASVLADPIERCGKRVPLSDADLSRIDAGLRELFVDIRS